MTSFGYRSNPRYAIKECSSCETLYTRDCACSIGTVEDKILVSKPPKNCARCTRYGYLVDGPHCQGCALLRQELKEILVTHSPDFQNTSEPSNASTSIVNAPREPYVVKQDNGSSVNNIIFDLNRAPDSPNQFHCFHCKDVLRDGEACKRCTCAKCGSGLSKGLCYICGHNQSSLNDSLSISETSSQIPLNINHCCYECGDPLDGIFCKRCTCKSCGKDAHISYNCSSKVPVISIAEPCNNQTINELPQALLIFHLTFHSEAESPFTLDSTPTYVDESPNVFNPPPQPPVYPCEFCGNDAYFGHYCTPQAPFIYRSCVTIKTLISCKIFKMFRNNILVVKIAGLLMNRTSQEEKRMEEEQAVKAQSWKFPVCYDDDDDEESSNPLEDNIIFELPSYSAVTPTEPVDSLIMEDKHLNTIPVTESDEFTKSCVENLVPNPSPEYPGYLAPAVDEIVAEDQAYADYDSPIALSLRYVADSDPEEDLKENSEDGLVDYPADGGNDDDSSNDNEEDEEHLASADSVDA
uniref:Uncharacterized protein n=1 Tax=Tanacetum cinerariifolium TaxID=118510 RepID=A0A6L2NGL9_TANCI|nr:hypothetical protein [Tanacetum cinerariifolium]